MEGLNRRNLQKVYDGDVIMRQCSMCQDLTVERIKDMDMLIILKHNA